MKLKILNEKELTNVVGGGYKLKFFTTGLKEGAMWGPIGVIRGIKGTYNAVKYKKLLEDMYPDGIAGASGMIAGGTASTAAVCGIAYGAYRLGKYVYNKIAK